MTNENCMHIIHTKVVRDPLLDFQREISTVCLATALKIHHVLFEARVTGQSMAMLSPRPTNIDKPYRKKAKHRSNKLGSPRLHTAYLASTWRKVTQVNRRKECTKLWLLASRCVLNWSKKKPAVLPAIRRQKEPSQVCISYYKTKNPTSHVINKTWK